MSSTGELLWTGDKLKLHDGWNIYAPATVQDLDYDGVGEIVIAHGGDPIIPAGVSIKFKCRHSNMVNHFGTFSIDNSSF